MTHPVFFRPPHAWVGDVIPYVEDGEFQLFYLYDVRRSPKPGTPWHLVTTRNVVDFIDRGVAFESGTEVDADFNAYTGSVVRDEAGVRHLFYTGQNPEHRGADGLPLQLVMHATSADGLTSWVRHPEHTFGAPKGYEPGDWRDPFVFRDDATGVWRMLVAARHADGPERRRGTIAQCVSADLVHWEVVEPFWDPRRYVAHECPEVFRWGGWWYLVYSEFSESFTTRYRMARELSGPWTVPAQDSIDGRAFYAAKSAERDGRRFFFGWIASKEGAQDDGAWQWAGTMSVLEATQNEDGTLSFGFPWETLESFADPLPIRFDASDSAVFPLLLEAPDGYRAVVSDVELPVRCHVSVTFDIAPNTTECGILLRASDDGDQGYALRLEPRRRRLVIDRWPRPRTGDGQWEISGDVPFALELERAADLSPGRHTLDVVMDGDLCVANLDGCTSLSTRLYDRPAGRLGLFVGEGSAMVRNVRVNARSSPLAPASRAAADSAAESSQMSPQYIHN